MGRVSRRLKDRNAGRRFGAPLAALAAMPDLLVAALFFVVPLGVLVAFSFGEENTYTFDVAVTGTVDRYREALGTPYLETLGKSLVLGVITSLACLIVAFPTALALTRLKGRTRLLMLFAVMFPFVVSFTVRTYAWLGILRTGGPVAELTDSLFGHPIVLAYKPAGIAVGMIHGYLALAILPLYAALDRIPDSVLDAADDLGARPFRRLRTVIVPMAIPGVIAALALVGILAIGEFTVPAILGGGKTLLIGNVLAEQAGGANQPLGGAIAVVLLVLFGLIGALAFLAQRRLRRMRTVLA